MPSPLDRGTLEHLVIRAHLRPDYKDQPVDQFEAYVNPSEITLGYEVEYDGQSGAGTTGSRMEFKKIKPGELSLSFFIDGTGANGRRAQKPGTCMVLVVAPQTAK